MISLDQVYVVKEDLVIRPEDQVLFHTRKNIIIECNEVGFQIILALNGQNTVRDIVEEMVVEYDAKKEEIEEAVIEFISMSLEDDLIEIKQ